MKSAENTAGSTAENTAENTGENTAEWKAATTAKWKEARIVMVKGKRLRREDALVEGEAKGCDGNAGGMCAVLCPLPCVLFSVSGLLREKRYVSKRQLRADPCTGARQHAYRP